MSAPSNEYVTSIISVVVRPEAMKRHERWIERINADARRAPGFFSVDIIKPRDNTQPEYVVVLKFDSYESLKNWQSSEGCKRLSREAEDHIVHLSDDQRGIGMEMWFTRPDNTVHYPTPAYYKQVLVALLAVYPLSTLVGMVLRPWIETLPMALQSLIVIAVMCALMTWPVMPYMTRWMQEWLYHAPRQK